MADLRLSIAVDSTGAIQSVKTFNAEVDQIPGKAKGAGSALDSMKRQFDNFAAGIGVGTGIGLAVKGFDLLAAGARELVAVLTGGAKALSNYSDKMVTLNQRTGLAVSSLQVLNSMAKTSGTDVDSLAKAAVRMEIAIGKGDASFQKLGLSLSSLKAMSPDAAFAKVAESIGKIEDPMQKAAAAVAIFGKSGAEMLPVFATNMEEARRKAEEFGLVLSDKTLSSAEALGDAVDTARMALDAFLMRLAGIVAQSPAMMAAIEEMSKVFGMLSKSVDGNQSALTKWVDYGLDLAADAVWTLIFAIQKAIAAIGVLSGASFGGASGWFSGINSALEKMKAITEQTRLAMKAKSEWASIDMGGKGVLLPGGTLGKQGGGGGTFDPSPSTIAKIVELSVKSQRAQQLIDFSSVPSGTMQGGSKNYNLWGDRSKFMPMELDGNVHVGGADPVRIPAINTAQALQNLANVAALSSSKLGKSIAGISGGLAGILAGKDSMKGLGGGIAGVLGKISGVGGIVSAGLGVFSAIKGLFGGGKPKTPPPEPPKQATAAAWSSFTGDQLSKGAAGVLAGVSGIRVATPEDMASQASIASMVFWQTFKEKGLMAAADAFRPVRDKMLETFKAAGASDSTIAALLGPMSAQIDLAGSTAFKGAAEGSKGFADALAAMANSQLPMTIDQFRAFEQQAVAGYEQMKQAAIDQGLSSEEAIRNAAIASGTYLTTLKDAASKYGFELGSSQSVLDAASGAGVAFAGDSQERLIMSLDALTETLGGAPPKFEQAISNAGRNAAGGASGVETTADMLGRGFVDLGDRILDGIKNLPAPQIYMDSGALVGGIAGAIDRGNTAILTAIEGR